MTLELKPASTALLLCAAEEGSSSSYLLQTPVVEELFWVDPTAPTSQCSTLWKTILSRQCKLSPGPSCYDIETTQMHNRRRAQVVPYFLKII